MTKTLSMRGLAPGTVDRARVCVGESGPPRRSAAEDPEAPAAQLADQQLRLRILVREGNGTRRPPAAACFVDRGFGFEIVELVVGQHLSQRLARRPAFASVAVRPPAR